MFGNLGMLRHLHFGNILNEITINIQMIKYLYVEIDPGKSTYNVEYTL